MIYMRSNLPMNRETRFGPIYKKLYSRNSGCIIASEYSSQKVSKPLPSHQPPWTLVILGNKNIHHQIFSLQLSFFTLSINAEI